MNQLPKELCAVHQAEKRASDIYDDRPLAPEDDVNDEAVSAFLNRREAVRCQLKILDDLMEVEEHYAPSEIHWGHSGSLAHVESILEQAIRFLLNEHDDA